MLLKTVANAEIDNNPAVLQRRDRPLRTALTCVLIISFVLELVFWAAFLLSPLRYRIDFRELYVSGYMARAGHLHKIYDLDLQRTLQNRLVSPGMDVLPFNHLPFETLMFAPFSLLSFNRAYFVWLLANLLMLWLCVYVLKFGVGDKHYWLACVTAIVFVPVQIGLMHGQDSIVLLLLVTLAYISLSATRDLIAGMLLALGLFKFQLIIPVAAIFFLRGRWRLIVGFSSTALVLFSVSAWMVGGSQIHSYIGQINIFSPKFEQGLGHQVAWAKMANLEGLWFGIGVSHLGPHTVHVCAILSSAVLFLAVVIVTPINVGSPQLLLIALVTTLLTSPYAYAHDLTLLVLPILACLDRREGSRQFSWIGYSSFGLYCAMLWQFVVPNHFYLVALFVMQFLLIMLRAERKAVAFVLEAQA